LIDVSTTVMKRVNAKRKRGRREKKEELTTKSG
jgi:hypothetical protein